MRYRDHAATDRPLGADAHRFENRKSHPVPRLVAALLALTMLSSCDQQPSPPLVLTRPLRQDTLITHSYVCRIHAFRNVEIHAPERGRLEDISVQEGQRLQEGNPMFKILPQIHNAALKRAEAQAQVAKTEYEKTEHMIKTGAASEKDLAEAAAKRDQKLADLRLAQAHPGFTLITAPFSGLMGRLRLGKGSVVNAKDVLTTLSDNSQMWADFIMPEAQYQEYSASLPADDHTQVRLSLANGRMFDQTGHLAPVEPALAKAASTIPRRALFPNPKGLLRHGQTGNIHLQSTLKKALLVPFQSTFEVSGHRCLHVMDKDHIIRQKQISVTHELDGLLVVTSGVNENDTILLDGAAQVHEGERVENSQFEEPAVAYPHSSLKKE